MHRLARTSLFALALGLVAQFTSAAPQHTTGRTNAPPPAPKPPPAPTTPVTPSAEEPLVYVLMDTTKGDIVLELNREKAPVSVANFLSYADKAFYDGTIFHRVISGFMIQGGGFTTDMKQKVTDGPIKNEWQNGLKNARGTIAMARTNAPDSATCQFFINVVDNANLDQPISGGAGYCVFGKVVAGMAAVDAIKAVPTGMTGGMRDVPKETVTIEKVSRLTPEEAKKRIEAETSKAASS
jgi:peptidyl-prolyl cis-trans isomerase A (cyclophilin A)/peptidyl-prolyl cis-trans isomerase B (cyclophilin B)